MGQIITVSRMGALGDVILTTPVIRRLKRENPEAEIIVQTAYPDVFRSNPNAQANMSPAVVDISLDLAYEKHPDRHIVRAYMQEAFGDPGKPDDLQQELFFPKTRNLLRYGHRPLIAVHAARAGWSNRTLPRTTWMLLIRYITKSGMWPVLVGTERDDLPGIEITRFHTPNIQAQAAFISGCAVFVGSDSALLHVAGTTDTPIVGIFTCALPETRMPWRHGSLGWKSTAIVPDLPCVGCLARRDPPVTTEHCERGDNACVKIVDYRRVLDAIENFVV